MQRLGADQTGKMRQKLRKKAHTTMFWPWLRRRGALSFHCVKTGTRSSPPPHPFCPKASGLCFAPFPSGVGEVQAGNGVGRGGRGGEWREGGLEMRGRGARSTTRQRRARQQVSHGSWWHEHRQWRPRCQVLASAAVAAAPATVAGRARATDGGGGGTAPRRPRSGESGGDEGVADGSKGGSTPGTLAGRPRPGWYSGRCRGGAVTTRAAAAEAAGVAAACVASGGGGGGMRGRNGSG